jgi:hypothetical protein
MWVGKSSCERRWGVESEECMRVTQATHFIYASRLSAVKPAWATLVNHTDKHVARIDITRNLIMFV